MEEERKKIRPLHVPQSQENWVIVNDIHSHGNNIHPHSKPDMPLVRKVPADSVPYGESISRNGQTVWAAYSRTKQDAKDVKRCSTQKSRG